MISIQDVSKSYNSKKVLDQFSLSIAEGEVISLIGPSGCGKSTLIRTIMGLVEIDRGRISISGETLTKKNVQQLRQKMGYVIQKGGLFPHLTAKENCTLVVEYLKWDPDRINARIDELTALVNIDPIMMKRLPTQLSGGQQQRISLIRSLMLDPDILLLDEPLGSIDPLVRYELQTDLKEIFTSLTKTVLLVTHDLGEAAFLGDRVILMKDGNIEQQGTAQEIIKAPKSEFVRQFVTAQRSPLEGLNK